MIENSLKMDNQTNKKYKNITKRNYLNNLLLKYK